MPKSIRTQTIKPALWKPFPWSKYSLDDFPRQQPLAVCPSTHCRRARKCLAAHKGVYCQRTHFNRSEGELRTPKSRIEKDIAEIPRPPLGVPNDIRLLYIEEITALRKIDIREKTRLWKAGGYGDTYGRYRASGVMKSPPPKIYIEE